MTTLSIRRPKSVWIIFIITVLISVLFVFINLSEFINVGILQQTNGYPFGAEGPTPWYYKTPQLYATVNFVYGLFFLSTLVFGSWTFKKVKKRPLFINFIVTLLLIFIQIVSGLSN